MFIFILSVLCFLQKGGNGLDVKLNYSFKVPEKFGVADVDSVGCCPHNELPDNVTHGMVVPTIFGLGVQKGGTTTLYAQLMQHPQLHEPATKELHYLDDVSKDLQSYLKNWAWNTDRLARSSSMQNGTIGVRHPEHGGLFEISPSYIFIPIAACKAKVVSPWAKFVVLLREPADRTYSGYTYIYHMARRAHEEFHWMSGFLTTVMSGMKKIAFNPKCDFQTGRGIYTYNDCARCLAFKRKMHSKCYGTNIFYTDSLDDDYTCNKFGVELILRGFYAAQLSWWFTLFDPSQFRIYNSVDYFKDPLPILEDIADFLELTVPYSQEMLDASEEKANSGYYLGTDEEELELATSILNDYYRRPNLELYKLLHETGHTEFTPFDKDLLEVDTLDCMDPDVTSTGVCGDGDLLRYFNKEDGFELSLPENSTALIYFKAEDLIRTKKEAQKVIGNETLNKVSVKFDSAASDDKTGFHVLRTYAYSKRTSYFSYQDSGSSLAIYILFTITFFVLLMFGIRYKRELNRD